MTERKRPSKKNIHRLQHILTGTLVIMLLYIVWYQWDSVRAEQKHRQLLALAGITRTQESVEKSNAAESAQQTGTDDAPSGKMQTTGPEESETPAEADSVEQETVLQNQPLDYDRLIEVNSDVRGWIGIPGTKLSLPVLQGKDNEFYLTHDFYGDNDRHGSIFADCGADLNEPQLNTVLYGHHMRDGSMFGLLENYAHEEFYRENPVFVFNSLTENRTYEILAVVKCSLAAGENEFRYYDYKSIADEETFLRYYKHIKSLSLYDIPVSASYGDELVTLCTCDYSVQYGRLLVIGKKAAG